MDYSVFSERYETVRLTEDQTEEIYILCRKNPLYYRHCPPFVTRESIAEDMKALPPDKEMSDKYYLGFYEGRKLIAVMDLIDGYPDRETAFIGFFMTEASLQKRGIGSGIIQSLGLSLKRQGYRNIRLGWVSTNPQAQHFWHKNGFTETGITYHTGAYTVVVAQKIL